MGAGRGMSETNVVALNCELATSNRRSDRETGAVSRSGSTVARPRVRVRDAPERLVPARGLFRFVRRAPGVGGVMP